MALENDWTIMVYLAGDNNLSENMAFALNDLSTLQDLNTGRDPDQPKVNVLAYFDSNSLTAPTHYIDYSEFDDAGKPVTKTIREGNAASANSVLDFVKWCLEDRNKKTGNYALIFSGHSEAFKDTTLLMDESSGNNMTLWKLRYALKTICDKYLEGDKIDILGFDSCLMSMLEVGYELKDYSKTIVGSEGSIPNSGWNYASLLRVILQDSTNFKDAAITEKFVKDLARQFVEAYIEYFKGMAIGGRSVDISAWDLAGIEPLARSVNDLAAEFNQYLDLTEKVESKSLEDIDIARYQELKKIILQSHMDAQTYMKEQSVDIKDLCQRLIWECSFMVRGEHKKVFETIIEKCEAVIKAVDKCVIRCGYVGEEYQFSNGIAIYFPWTLLTLSITNYNYRYLKFIAGRIDDEDFENSRGIGKDWRKFLINYLSRVTFRQTRKVFSNRENKIEKISDIEDFSRDNPVWSRDNPPWSRDNPPWSRDNPPWSRVNPPWSRDNPPWSRDNPPWSRGQNNNSTFYFAKFKNFQLSWTISGYADETGFPDKKEFPGEE
jgi:hypothetical protein